MRASYNAIKLFSTSSNIMITDLLEMSFPAVEHFKSVLGPHWYSPPSIPSPSSWFMDHLDFQCDPQQAQAMLSFSSSEEIRKLFFKLNTNKAPGLDGLTSGFIKSAWDFVGEEAIASVKHFFTYVFLPATANSTILSLVPNFPGASKVSEFRPIARLNTVYKVISRILVARLKPILQHLILPRQTAFVKDRLLVVNTILFFLTLCVMLNKICKVHT